MAVACGHLMQMPATGGATASSSTERYDVHRGVKRITCKRAPGSTGAAGIGRCSEPQRARAPLVRLEPDT